MSYTWQRDPDSGGVKITDLIKVQVQQRITKHAEENLAGRYTKLNIKFRSQFCYVDAFAEPDVADGWPPAEHPEQGKNTSND